MNVCYSLLNSLPDLVCSQILLWVTSSFPSDTVSWARKGHCPFQQHGYVSVDTAKRSSHIKSRICSPVTDGWLLCLKASLGSIHYMLATAFIRRHFHLNVLKWPRAFSTGGRKERIYLWTGKITHLTVIPWELWCDRKPCTKQVLQPSPAVTFLFAVQLDWNLGTWSSKGRDITSTPHWASAHGGPPVRSGFQHAFACLLLPMGSKLKWCVCSLYHCSLPVSRPSNKEWVVKKCNTSPRLLECMMVEYAER